MYWNRSRAAWETVESYKDHNGHLICNTDHFSTWTVAKIEDIIEALQNSIHTAYVYAGIAAFITIVLALGLYARVKRKK